MAKKGPRPSYRIDKLKDRYLITAYPVVGRAIVFGEQIEVGLHDKVELLQAAEALVLDTRERFTSQRSV